MTKLNHDYLTTKSPNKALDLSLIFRLFAYLRPYKGLLLFSLLMMIFTKTLEVIIPLWIGKLSEHVLGSMNGSEINYAFSTILQGGGGVIALLFLTYCLDALNALIKNWIGQKGVVSLRCDLFDQIQRLPLSFHDEQSVGRLVSRTVYDVEQIHQMYAESLIPILGNMILLTGIAVCVTYLNWKVAIATSLFMPALWWLTIRFGKKQKECYSLIRAIIARLNSFVQEQLMGASTIRLFGQQERERGNFEQINSDHCHANIESIRNLSFFMAGIELIHNGVLIAVFLSLAMLAVQGAPFDASLFFTFSLYALMLFRPISDLAERYNVLQAAVAAGERIFALLDLNQEPYEQQKGKDLEQIHDIVFDNVWFFYKEEEWVLKGISFSLRQGESVAIVGMTGVGKTTLIHLLMRFYTPQKGRILINGVDINEYSLHSLRQQMSFVMQDPVLFSGTVTDNISLHRKEIPDQQVSASLEYLDLADVIKKFPQGIDTPIGERGTCLSVGEQQLISLARAVAHGGSLFLLDEATANIDSESERKIQRALGKILKERSSLVVAHRLSTIRDVDKIVVLHQGTIREEGSHEALLRKSGIYEKLYRLQFNP